jgi:hypothetical protein
MTSPAWVPEACTLLTAEQPLRLAEFDALSATGSGVRLSPTQLRLDLGADVDAIRDLARRESECCSFFTFTITTPQPGRVCLDIEVPAGHVNVLDALAKRAGGL